MSATPPSDTNATQRKWLPWVIGIVVLLFLAWWMRGCGKAPGTGPMADTTQSMMMAPDTAPAPAPAAAASAAPVETAAPASAEPAPVKGTTGAGPRIKADSAPAAAPQAAPAPTGPGAMGGQGEPGKKPPATTP